MADNFGRKRGLDDIKHEDPNEMIPEAEEDRAFNLDDDDVVEEIIEGDDLNEQMDKDYRAIPELDQYVDDGVDEEEYERLDYGARAQADKLISQRNREKQAQGGRLPAAFLNETEGSLYSDGQDLGAELRHRREIHYQEVNMDEEGDFEDEDMQPFEEVDNARGKLDVWIKEPRTI